MIQGVVGKGSPGEVLSTDDIRTICRDALSPLSLGGRRVLVLVPDHTRHAPIDLFFHVLFDLVGRDAQAFDILVATGTHAPMPMERLYAHVGITAREHATSFRGVQFFNHEHDNRARLASLGSIPAAEIAGLTGGLFREDIEVTINARALEYDHILMVSPVVPHEAMGFAGGNKYFFPGIAGLNVVETFHWLAALITNPVVNGVKDTPTRRVIDRAVQLLTTPRTCFAFAVDEHHRLACLFAGDPLEAWSRAADVSSKIHITYLDEPVHAVLGVTPAIYEEIWVAGKAMYKIEPVVADGGELVIFGPQIKEISFTHGPLIRRIGYHVRDYFLRQWDRFAGEPKLILAHSTNVRGIGTFDNGVEHARIQVTLATAIPEEVCRAVNLGYRDPRSIDPEAWKKRRGTMVEENAGQVLYRLRE